MKILEFHHIFPITEVEILNYKKGSNLVSSILFYFLMEVIQKEKRPDKIVIFVDNCGGQNKNNVMI